MLLRPLKNPTLIAASLGYACVASAALLSKAAGLSLFFEVFPKETLPLMLIGSAVLLGVLALSTLSAIARYSEAKVVYGGISLIIGCLIAIWWSVKSGYRPAFAAAYFAADVVIYVPMVLFWRLASRLFDPRSAKRYLSIVAASGTVTCILAGMALGAFTTRFGTSSVFLLVSFLLLVFLLIVATFLAPASPSKSTSKTKKKTSLGFGFGVAEPRFAIALGMVVATSAIAITFVQFQFQVGATARLQGDELTAYFGLIYGIGGGLSLFCQLILARRVFALGGLSLALRLLPICLLLASSWSLLIHDFHGIVAARLAILALAFSIDLAGMQILYLGLPTASRERVRTTIELALKPAAIAVSGLLLLLLKDLPTTMVAVVASASLIWFFPLVKSAHRQYINSLAKALRAPSHEFSSEDLQNLQGDDISQTVVDAVRVTYGERLLVLADLAKRMNTNGLEASFRELLSREDSTSKVAALNYLAEKGSNADLEDARALLISPHQDVRTAALRCYLLLGGEPNTAIFEQVASQGSPETLTILLVAMLVDESLENQQVGMELLQRMSMSSDSSTRVAAVKVTGEVSGTESTEMARVSLKDEAIDVRIAAIRSFASRRDPELFEHVLGLFSDPEMASALEEVLPEYDALGRKKLIDILVEHSDKPSFIGSPAVLRIIAYTGGADLDVVQPYLVAESQKIRLEAAKALCAMPATRTQKDLEFVTQQIFRTLSSLTELKDWLNTVYTDDRGNALLPGLHEAYEECVLELLYLLKANGLEFDPDRFHRPLSDWEAPMRAKALEFFDEALSGRVRADFVAHFEPERRPRSPLDEDGFRVYLTEIASSNHFWGALTAQWLLSADKRAPEHMAVLSSPDPNAASPLLEKQGGVGLIGRVLLLREVPLFRDLSLDDIAILASLMESEHFPAETQLFFKGDPGDRLFVVAEGRVSIHDEHRSLSEVVAGGYFGELSLLDGAPRSASARCVVDSILFTMNAESFQVVLRRHSDVALAITRSLAHDLRTERTKQYEHDN